MDNLIIYKELCYRYALVTERPVHGLDRSMIKVKNAAKQVAKLKWDVAERTMPIEVCCSTMETIMHGQKI